MCFVVEAGQLGQAQVSVSLGGGESGVAQKLLYGAQVRSPLEEMGGKTVPQGVGADGFLNASGLTESLYDPVGLAPLQPLSPLAKE